MLQKNVSLQPFNTFGIECNAAHLATFNSVNELKEVLQRAVKPLLILGGGSNILFTQDFDGTVLKNEILGIEVVQEDEDYVELRVGAGEIWHEFVLYCVRNNYGGIENLSLIPGTVGASPMQNIGAYGVEIKDVFVQLEALNLDTLELEVFDHAACSFGYRESVFKRALKDKYVITAVTYRLTKRNHQIKTSYGAIQDELTKKGIVDPKLIDISEAVIAIRQSKLPDPKEIGNAGSFFKNPVVEFSVLENIQKSYDNVPNYPATEGYVKLAAGWLIEQAGWKGFRSGDFGVHSKQALVLVNYKNAKGSEIEELSQKIIRDIHQKFGVSLEREVNLM